MKNYVVRKYMEGEGLGGMMGEFANLYAFHIMTGLIPSCLCGEDSLAFKFFNKEKENVLNIFECFPKVKEDFQLLNYSDYEWNQINIGHLRLEPLALKVLEDRSRGVNYNVDLRSFKVCYQWYPKKKHIYDLFAFNESLIKKSLLNIPRNNNKKIIAVSVRMEYFLKQKQGENVEHISLSIDFYKKAFAFFGKLNNTFLIFSDYIHEASELLKPLEKEYDIAYTKETLSSAEGMATFSLCDHFISSNSSFSFWGALLSKSENKKIICCEKFLYDHSPSSGTLNGRWYPPEFTAINQI